RLQRPCSACSHRWPGRSDAKGAEVTDNLARTSGRFSLKERFEERHIETTKPEIIGNAKPCGWCSSVRAYDTRRRPAFSQPRGAVMPRPRLARGPLSVAAGPPESHAPFAHGRLRGDRFPDRVAQSAG